MGIGELLGSECRDHMKIGSDYSNILKRFNARSDGVRGPFFRFSPRKGAIGVFLMLNPTEFRLISVEL